MKVTVSEKGQIVIPAEIRRKYGLERGTKVEIHDKNGLLEIKVLPRYPLVLLKGKLKGKTSLVDSLLAERKKEIALEDE